MKLTRRDALKALAAGSIAGVGSLTVSELAVRLDGLDRGQRLSEDDVETAKAVAEVVYPSQVTVSPDFVEAYYSAIQDELRGGAVRAIRDLDTASRREFGATFASVGPPAKRDDVLRALGVNRAQSDSDGTLPERARYFLVNGLLYALFTTPQGSELFGIDDPKGYPGGFATYRAEVKERGSVE